MGDGTLSGKNEAIQSGCGLRTAQNRTSKTFLDLGEKLFRVDELV